MSQKAIAEACKRAGGQSALARRLGCTPQAVQRMYATGRVPPARVLAVESLTGVSRYALRPDIFGASPPLPSLPAPTFSSSGRGGPSQRTALEAAA